MRDVLEAMEEELQKRHRCVLCTVMKTEGSVPRKAGAVMMVRADGSFAGTVGGGRTEAETLRSAALALCDGQNRCVTVHLAPSAGDGVDEECGGWIRVGLIVMDPENIGDVHTTEDALTASMNCEEAWLLIETGEDDVPSGLRLLRRDERGSFSGSDNKTVGDDANGKLKIPVFRGGRCVIFGAGHVGRATASLLSGIGFETIVYDDRPELAVQKYFPGTQIICGDYAEAEKHLELRHTDYVLVMTSGHQSDHTVIVQALQKRAFYLGALGSRRKAAALRNLLLEEGFSEEDFRRIHTPIGLDIGAETPAEIAVSIAAEILAVRSGRKGWER